MELVFASRNPGKYKEVAKILGNGFNVLSLNETGCNDSIPEPFYTLEENALAKARFVFETYGVNCFADDSGLEVDALGGKPGVDSAHYAGMQKSSVENIRKLLHEMKGISMRTARFRSVIALIIQGREFVFEGIVNGSIGTEPKGERGFGYDPIFIPEGFDQTFGELPDDIKNTLSHRAQALHKMAAFLNPKWPD
ncbi:MAG TPA: RdgB/HAM1 family non-canonical purine NTP pyrophosphatase [Bacteroidales bacterium]|nr:RdgB/HAM1 family non-canonical purine NTP pyrophosphatase [Bacteroidales bacterium]